MKGRKLGTDLQSLLNDLSGIEVPDSPGAALVNVRLSQCFSGKFQPRRNINQETIEELAQSIKRQGIIQPIVVRYRGSDGYEIVAGERRVLASKHLGLDTIPAIVRNIEDEVAVAFALVENIQRESLTVIDEALAMQNMVDRFGWTHQEVAQVVGKSRSAVSNLLRLLNLESQVVELLDTGKFEMGHARCLLSLSSDVQVKVADMAVKKSWSVRQTEQYVRFLSATKVEPKAAKKNTRASEDNYEKQLTQHLDFPVSVQTGRENKGKIVIHYSSQNQLSEIVKRMMGKK